MFLWTLTQKRRKVLPLPREALGAVFIEIQHMLDFRRVMSCLPEMLCLEKGSRRGVHAEPRELLLRVVQAEDVEVVVVVFVLRLSQGRLMVEVLPWMLRRKLALGRCRRLHGRYPRAGAIASCAQVLLFLREALGGVLIEIQNMLEFGRLMLCLPEMLCLEKGSRRGVHAEPRGVLVRVVQAGDVEVVVVVVVLRLSPGRVIVEVLRWMAGGKLV